jgi:hypothetical protein
VDYYGFTVVRQKCTLTIKARGNGINYDDLSVTNPEFCVGQLLTFIPSWDSGPPNVVNTAAYWHLPEKFVNEPTNYSLTCVTYHKNTDLLTNLTQQCWYVNDSGGACRVRETLHFSNGQYVNIAAMGNFTIFRPTISNFTPVSGTQIMLDTNSIPNIYLGLGDSSGGGMGWTLMVNLNTNFSASIFYDQLIDREWSWDRSVWYGHVPKSNSTGESFWLDNGSPYGAATVIQNSNSPKPHSQLTLVFGDGPSLEDTLYSFADLPDTFKTYLRFQPIGGIPITIGRVDWGWHGRTDGSYSTSIWTLTTHSVTGPTLYAGDDSFPVWPETYHNTGGN